MRRYISLTRVRDAAGLLIAQPFNPMLFRQGGTNWTYHFDEFNVPGFSSSRVSDEEITSIIRSVSSRHGYLIDPHTACAFGNLDDLLPCAVLSTAHPAKFPEVIGEAVGSEPKAPSLEELKERPIVKYPLEPSAEAIQTFILDHTDF